MHRNGGNPASSPCDGARVALPFLGPLVQVGLVDQRQRVVKLQVSDQNIVEGVPRLTDEPFGLLSIGRARMKLQAFPRFT